MKNRNHTNAPVKLLACALGLLMNTQTHAGWILETEMDGGSLELPNDFQFSPGEEAENSLATFALGVQGGYIFSNHLFILGGITSGQSENLLGFEDRIAFSDLHLSTGVDWPVSEHVSLLASIGLADWHYTLKDQNSFGDNQAEKEQRGTGLQYRLGINYLFNPMISLGLHMGQKDFGEDINYQQYGVNLRIIFE
jgi:opacity protein-like surface antigen